MLGTPLGTISMCGMAAEMFAILMFEISDFTIGDSKMSKKQEEQIFSREFGKLGQERRVAVLAAYGLIDERTTGSFSTIRVIRRK